MGHADKLRLWLESENTTEVRSLAKSIAFKCVASPVTQCNVCTCPFMCILRIHWWWLASVVNRQMWKGALSISLKLCFCFRPKCPVLTEKCVSVGPITELEREPLPPRCQVICGAQDHLYCERLTGSRADFLLQVSSNEQVKTKLIGEKAKNTTYVKSFLI